jgi:hypothetical protein
MSENKADWTVQILAPAAGERSFRAEGEPERNRRGARVVDASVDTIKANWHETVQKLAEIGEGIDDGASGWGVSEIEVGLTLSAKGQLLFIAEASAEASVKIKLTRRQGWSPPAKVPGEI